MARDVIEIRLPAKSQYLPVLRAAIGVIAGALSFNYDEIIQLRVAVLEAYDLALQYLSQQEGSPEGSELSVRFTAGADRIEILIPASGGHMGQLDADEEREAKVLLASLVDELEVAAGPDGAPIIRMVKYRSSGEG